MEKDLKKLSDNMHKTVDNFLRNVGEYPDTATIYVHMFDGKYNNGIDGDTERLCSVLVDAMFEDPQLALVVTTSAHAFDEMVRMKNKMISQN